MVVFTTTLAPVDANAQFFTRIKPTIKPRPLKIPRLPRPPRIPQSPRPVVHSFSQVAGYIVAASRSVSYYERQEQRRHYQRGARVHQNGRSNHRHHRRNTRMHR